MEKTTKYVLGIFAALILLTGSFAGGFVTRHALAQTGIFPGFGDGPIPNVVLPPTAVPPAPAQTATTPGELQTLFVPFWEAWDIVHEQYVNQPVDDTLLMQGAIRGMMEAVGDDYTYYMDPQVYENESSSLSGEYEGIGAFVDTRGDYLTIVSPIEGSPAEAAGLRPGDMIIAIDGEDMTGYTPEEARQRVLGEAGTKVVLTVARAGEAEPLEFTIVRAKITVPSVTGEMLDGGIAYIDINTFGDNTTDELRAKLDELLAQNPKGIVIDLRYNPGGYLITSVEVASEFLEEGVVLIEQYGDGSRDTYRALGNGKATDLPLVILINDGSASASEIVAGALQDHGRAELVGTQSYGKGSVQTLAPLSNDQGAARVTIAKWLTPDGRAIESVGLTPDYLVELTEEDAANNRDPQLDKAVEILLGLTQ
ncbi:MAG: S41 family peptidase [Anaerolineales bacterium]|nr:S41 family peptidase [Anaerolineales bacterium]NUQ84028.1 S41 family peptidase [Anaerolineales bacterium]